MRHLHECFFGGHPRRVIQVHGLGSTKGNHAVHIVQVGGHNSTGVQLNDAQALAVVAQRIHK